MKTVILAGGLGTRLSEETTVKPKPMVEIGGYPILWHIMHIYAHYGFDEFVVALGYKGDVIKNYFLNYKRMHSNFKIQLATEDITVYDGECENWSVQLVDTGAYTQTGGRIKRLSKWLKDEEFLLTYGDGVANIDINQLVNFHKSSNKLATVTAVHPPSRFGDIMFEGNNVAQFHEKPQVSEGWINGGFFVLNPTVFDYIEGDQIVWEKEPLQRLAKDNQLSAYRHEGYWQCMDTIREKQLLEDLWISGKAPWKVW
jgi:glucose-1-phosphate cytidylyltransferase